MKAQFNATILHQNDWNGRRYQELEAIWSHWDTHYCCVECKLAQLNGKTLVSNKPLEMAVYLVKFIALYMYVLYYSQLVLYFNENFTKYEVGNGEKRIKIKSYKPVLLYITYSYSHCYIQ